VENNKKIYLIKDIKNKYIYRIFKMKMVHRQRVVKNTYFSIAGKTLARKILQRTAIAPSFQSNLNI